MALTGQRLTKLRINSAGVLAVLKDPKVAADLTRRAEAINGALPHDKGEEWEVRSFMGHDRAQATVRTKNFAAEKAAAEDLALIRALDAGR
jgi:hypothetical protein